LLYASLLFLLVVPCAHVSAQEETGPDTDVVRVRTDLVLVPAFVTDTHDRRISGLKQADFAVRDNGLTMKVEHFATGTEHVALVFALDASGSIRENLRRQRAAALQLFARFGQGSHVAVLHFTKQAELAVPFTTDAVAAEHGFDFPALSNQRTAIYDSIFEALKLFDARTSDPLYRRIIILISDGLDTASNRKASSVIDEARERGVSVYAIQLPLFEPREGRLYPRPATKGFRDLAEKTGGHYFMVGDARNALDPTSPFDLAPVFKAIEEDLQGQYVIGYYAGDAARDGRFHRIQVTLTRPDQRRLRVRLLREGYQAQLAFPSP
jgi:Ca-activated chloride channel family protein